MASDELLERIEEALAGVEAEGGDAFPPMASVKRQLLWCHGYLRGEPVGAPPGPFTMGALAMRELDVYGDNPDLALEVYQIENEMAALLGSNSRESPIVNRQSKKTGPLD